jgi:hypothetical protein
MKMRGITLPRMFSKFEDYNTLWLKERCTIKLIRFLVAYIAFLLMKIGIISTK